MLAIMKGSKCFEFVQELGSEKEKGLFITESK